MTIRPKCYSRLDKFAGGEREVARVVLRPSTQSATVSEISDWMEENGEHTFREIMAKDPERIRNGRFNGMERIDKEMFQHLVHTQRRRQRWL